MSASALPAWNRLAPLPMGKWLFSRIVCRKAPYFSTIRPSIEELGPGLCRLKFRKRRSVLNHLNTVHAIAMCNAAELAAGMMTDASVPPQMRWIPTEMLARYLRMAITDLVVTARPRSAMGPSPGNYVVEVIAEDTSGTIVFSADITMRLSMRKPNP